MSIRMFDLFLIRWLPFCVMRLTGAQGILNSVCYKEWIADSWANWGSEPCICVKTMGLQLTRRGSLYRHLSGLLVIFWHQYLFRGEISTPAFIFRRKVYIWLFKENYHESKIMRKAGCQKDRGKTCPCVFKRSSFLTMNETVDLVEK